MATSRGEGWTSAELVLWAVGTHNIHAAEQLNCNDLTEWAAGLLRNHATYFENYQLNKNAISLQLYQNQTDAASIGLVRVQL